MNDIHLLRLIAVGLITIFCPLADATEFTIVTVNGYVGFAVPDDWRVLNMQTKPPISAAVFQVSNPADEGTPHSTNVVVTLFHTATSRGKEGVGSVPRRHGPTEPTVTSREDWTVYTQQATQGDATYTIIDAKKPIADVVVAVRFAWPHLPKNPPDYNTRMEGEFESMLRSVNGALGLPTPRQGEVIRRPTPSSHTEPEGPRFRLPSPS